MGNDTLIALFRMASDRLKEKDTTFKERMENWANSKSRAEISNIQYSAMMHTPESMQTSMMGWLKRQYNIAFKPVTGSNFFVHGMGDPEGRENIFLFYFDV